MRPPRIAPLLTARRAFPPTAAPRHVVRFSTTSQIKPPRARLLVPVMGAAATAVAGLWLLFEEPSLHLEEKKEKAASAPPLAGTIPLSSAHLHPIPEETLGHIDPRPFQHMPLSDLLSRYSVYLICGSMPWLVDRAPQLLDWALNETSIPGVKPITEWIVRKTFFKQVSYTLGRGDEPTLTFLCAVRWGGDCFWLRASPRSALS